MSPSGAVVAGPPGAYTGFRANERLVLRYHRGIELTTPNREEA